MYIFINNNVKLVIVEERKKHPKSLKKKVYIHTDKQTNSRLFGFIVLLFYCFIVLLFYSFNVLLFFLICLFINGGTIEYCFQHKPH